MNYGAIAAVFALFSAFYYVGVYIRNYKETNKGMTRIVFLNGMYGLLETLIINWIIFEVIFADNTANNELDIIKQLLVAIAICLKNGYSYKETLASLATPQHQQVQL